MRLSLPEILPQRYVMAIMALLAIANAYTMRVCLNLAITEMTQRTKKRTRVFDPDACQENNATYDVFKSEPHKHSNLTFDWSESTQGLLLSSFYYGYVLTHLPGGILSERFGGKWVVGLGLLSTALCTLATPTAVRIGGAPLLFVIRVIEGLGEGPTIPGLMNMMSRWAPRNERGRMGAMIFGGAQIGNIAGSSLSGIIMDTGSWDNVFYIFGGMGVLWFLLWCMLCYSTPNTHPYISQKEKLYLKENVDALKYSKNQMLEPVPWKALFRSVPLWCLIIAGIGHDWGYFTMVTDLPKYMRDVLKFNIKDAGFLSAAPYLVMWISSFFFGLACDFCVQKKWHSIKNARKIYTTIAATGPGVCILLASYSGCDAFVAVGWFVGAMALMGAYYSGMKINALDITPNYAGTTTALVNGVAALAGIISPTLIGLLTPDSTLKQWRVAFWVCFAVLVITNGIYLVWAEGEQLWWDDVKKYGYPAGWSHGPLPTRNKHSEIEQDIRNPKAEMS